MSHRLLWSGLVCTFLLSLCATARSQTAPPAPPSLDELKEVYRLLRDATVSRNEELFLSLFSEKNLTRLQQASTRLGRDFPGAIPYAEFEGILPGPEALRQTTMLSDGKRSFLFLFFNGRFFSSIQPDGDAVLCLDLIREGKKDGWVIDDLRLAFLNEFPGTELTGNMEPFLRAHIPTLTRSSHTLELPPAPSSPLVTHGKYPLRPAGVTVNNGMAVVHLGIGVFHLPQNVWDEATQQTLFGRSVPPLDFGLPVYGELEKRAAEQELARKELEARHAAMLEKNRKRAQADAGKAAWGVYTRNENPSPDTKAGPVPIATYWGTSESDTIDVVRVDHRGLFLLGGTFTPNPAWEILHESPSGTGQVMFWDPATHSVLGIIRTDSPVFDIRFDSQHNIYVKTASSLAKYDPVGGEMFWRTGEGGRRLAVTPNGHSFLLAGLEIHHIDPTGKKTGTWTIPNKGTGTHTKRSSHLVFDPKNNLVLASGNNSGNSQKSKMPVFVPWIVAYRFDPSSPALPAEPAWWLYNFTHTEVDPDGMADSRIGSMNIGPDGKLYFIGDTEGGNTPFNFSPLAMGQRLPGIFDGSPFNEMWRANSARKVTFVARVDPAGPKLEKASFIYGMRHDERRNQEMIGYNLGKDVAVDENGLVFVTGVSNSRIRWTEDAIHKRSLPELWKNNYGHPIAPDEMFLTILGDNFTKLRFNSGFGRSIDDLARFRSQGTAVAAHQGTAVIAGWVQRQIPESEANNPEYDPSPYHYRARPWQAQLKGGRNAYFAFYGPAPDTSATAMLKTHLRFLPLTKTAQAATTLPSAPNLPAAVRQLQQRLATQAAADPVIAQELEWIADCQLRVGFAQFQLAQAAWELDAEAGRPLLTAVATRWKDSEPGLLAAELLQPKKK